MATRVVVNYTAAFNSSITTRDGVISKVTTWQTNVSGSTKRTESEPAPKGKH